MIIKLYKNKLLLLSICASLFYSCSTIKRNYEAKADFQNYYKTYFMVKCVMKSASDTLYYSSVCDFAYPSTVPYKYIAEIDSLAEVIANETKYMAFEMDKDLPLGPSPPSRLCIMNACLNKCLSKEIQKRAEIQYRNYKKNEKELWSIGR